MTTHSHTQTILLKQLGIVPLTAKTEFFTQLAAARKRVASDSGTNAEIVAGTTAETTTDIAANSRYEAIPSTRLTDDIHTILQQTILNDWQIDNLASHCQIKEQLLITPPLALLQQPQLKRQLWQLLTGQFND